MSTTSIPGFVLINPKKSEIKKYLEKNPQAVLIHQLENDDPMKARPIWITTKNNNFLCKDGTLDCIGETLLYNMIDPMQVVYRYKSSDFSCETCLPPGFNNSKKGLMSFTMTVQKKLQENGKELYLMKNCKNRLCGSLEDMEVHRIGKCKGMTVVRPPLTTMSQKNAELFAVRYFLGRASHYAYCCSKGWVVAPIPSDMFYTGAKGMKKALEISESNVPGAENVVERKPVFLVYSTKECTHSQKVVSLLAKNNIPYEEIDVSQNLDVAPHSVRMSQFSVVPQVFIYTSEKSKDVQHVAGSSDEFTKYIDPLLRMVDSLNTSDVWTMNFKVLKDLRKNQKGVNKDPKWEIIRGGNIACRECDVSSEIHKLLCKSFNIPKKKKLI